MAPATGQTKTVVPVLALPWISPRLAELCAEHGWSWFDLAGNHRLDVPGLLHLQHTGNPPAHKSIRATATLSTPEAARVMRALLLPEHAGQCWTQRALQHHCQPKVSLGLVNKLVRHLQEEAFLEPGEDGGFQLRDPIKLLSAWRAAYRFQRHERLGFFTLLQGRKLQAALVELEQQAGTGSVSYAAFSAADFQAPNVRQPKTWLYLRPQELARLAKVVDAKPVDSGENLVVLIPEDNGVFYLGDGGTIGNHRLACTNVIQTYVDLCHCGNRGEEAAEALLNQRIKPEWKLHGLKV